MWLGEQEGVREEGADLVILGGLLGVLLYLAYYLARLTSKINSSNGLPTPSLARSFRKTQKIYI